MTALLRLSSRIAASLSWVDQGQLKCRPPRAENLQDLHDLAPNAGSFTCQFWESRIPALRFLIVASRSMAGRGFGRGSLLTCEFGVFGLCFARFCVLQFLIELRDRLIPARDVLLALIELRFKRREPLLLLLACGAELHDLSLQIIVRAGTGVRRRLVLEFGFDALEITRHAFIGFVLRSQALFQILVELGRLCELGL